MGFAEKEKIIDPNLYLKTIYKLKKDYENISISNCISTCMVDDKYKHLNNDILVGKTDFVNFLNCLFNDSIVLVVYIIFLIESEN